MPERIDDLAIEIKFLDSCGLFSPLGILDRAFAGNPVSNGYEKFVRGVHLLLLVGAAWLVGMCIGLAWTPTKLLPAYRPR